MTLKDRAQVAMGGFMCRNPEKVPSGYRAYFGLVPFPEPKAEHMQWDDGDGTARALDAWLVLRRITGDYETGKEIEEGQWRYLRHLLHPETGLVYVADLSVPNRDGYYYHLWDQGRTLRHLINRYEWPFTSEIERTQLESLIVSMINGLKHLSTTRRLEDGTSAVYWTHEVYWDNTPASQSTDFGFTIGSAQMLDPATRWAMLTCSEDDLEWAIQLANGFIAGLEHRRESTTPMFGASGEFYGHFHCAVSGLVGLVHLAHRLIFQGDEIGLRYLDTATRAYEWIFSEENINRGGSHGWFPESSVRRHSNVSEICCTADMIELATALASTTVFGEGYERFDKYWGDVERFTRNELFQSQILDPEKLERWVHPKTPESLAKYSSVIERIRGGWSFGHTWPHDLMDFDKDRIKDPSVPATQYLRVPIGGCCLYSGPRGLYAYLNAAAEFRPPDSAIRVPMIDIRFPLKYEDTLLVTDEVDSGGVSFIVKKPRRHKIAVRIPKRVDLKSVGVQQNGQPLPVNYDVSFNRVFIDTRPGAEYRVTWENPAWESYETLGPPNDGRVPGVPVGSRIRYRLRFVGNQLQEMIPSEGAYLPYEKGV
jgi:hypothetical protein